MADDLNDWLREMRRDDRHDNYRLAGRVRLYSTMRWAEWANKRKAAQPDLARAAKLLYDLFSENAELRRDRDGLVQLVRDLQPFIRPHDNVSRTARAVRRLRVERLRPRRCVPPAGRQAPSLTSTFKPPPALKAEGRFAFKVPPVSSSCMGGGVVTVGVERGRPGWRAVARDGDGRPVWQGCRRVCWLWALRDAGRFAQQPRP